MISEAKRRTIAELIDRYVREVIPQKKHSSQGTQKAQLLWWKAQIGAYLLCNVTPALLGECRDRLAFVDADRKVARSPVPINGRSLSCGAIARLHHGSEPSARAPGSPSRNYALASRPTSPCGHRNCRDAAEGATCCYLRRRFKVFAANGRLRRGRSALRGVVIASSSVAARTKLDSAAGRCSRGCLRTLFTQMPLYVRYHWSRILHCLAQLIARNAKSLGPIAHLMVLV